MGDVLPADSTGTRRSRGPSPHKTAKTRAAIAHAALELFLERGYRAARISDVADRAGVAKAPFTCTLPINKHSSPVSSAVCSNSGSGL